MTFKSILCEFLTLYRQLIYASPWHTGSAILLRILTQIALLALLLLPWKLLVVLYGGMLPEVAPASLHAQDQDHQVLILGIAILLAMALHAGCELAAHRNIRSGAASVCNLANKISLFPNQSSEAKRLYSHLLQALSALITCLLACAFIAAAYPSLLPALAIYLLASGVSWQFLVAPYPERRLRLSESLPMLMKIWWQSGFLLVLAWVLMDYRKGQLPSMLSVLASLILARQLLLLSSEIVQRWLSVYRASAKARALFLHRDVWQPAIEGEAGFEMLLEQEKRETWIGELLNELGEVPLQTPAVSCRLADAGRIAYLQVSMEGSSRPHPLLLKLHSRTRESAAEQEWCLLQAAGHHWPAPAPLFKHRVENHLCLSLEWGTHRSWLDSRERNLCLPDLRRQLLSCDIEPTLEERYDRTHAPLTARLQSITWEHLQSHVQDSTQLRTCAKLSEIWQELRQAIATLPRQLLLPRLQHRLIARDRNVDGESSVLLYNWSQWRWEPLGSGHPLSARLEEELEQALEQASRLREPLSNASPQLAACAARVYEFERRYSNKNFTGAINMLDGILEQWRRYSATSGDPSPSYISSPVPQGQPSNISGVKAPREWLDRNI